MSSVIERLRVKHRRVLSAGDDVRSVPIMAKDVLVDAPRNPRDVVMIATTDATDLEDQVVLPEGADLSYFLGNRAVFADHEYTVDKAVAKLRNVGPWPNANHQRGWKVRANILGGKMHPLGDVCMSLAQHGILGCSIGMKVLDVGPPNRDERERYPNAASIVRSWLWLELSFTSLPCNADCSAGVEIETPNGIKKRIVVVDWA